MQTTSQTIKNLTIISKRTNNTITSHTGKYFVPSKDCNKYYIAEIQRNLGKIIYEHKRSINLNVDRNALFSDMLDHIFSTPL